MKTRSKKSSTNTSNNSQNNRRKPLGDKTNNVSALDNMTRKSNAKVATRQTRKNIGDENKLDNKRRISDRLKATSPEKGITIIDKPKIKVDKSAKKSEINTKLKKGKNVQNLNEFNKNGRLRSNSKVETNKSQSNEDKNVAKLDLIKNKRISNNLTDSPLKPLINEERNKTQMNENKNETNSEINLKLLKGKTGSNNKNRRLINEHIKETKVQLNSSVIKDKTRTNSGTIVQIKNIEKTDQNLKENRKNKKSNRISKDVTNENNKLLINEHKNETKIKCATEVPLKNADKTEQAPKENTINCRLKGDSKNVTIENLSKTNKEDPDLIKNNSKIFPHKNQINNDTKLALSKEKCETNPENKRLLGSFKFTSSENNSDPYEFKFDPKKEPKRKPKKRGRPKKHDSTSESSDEEDNSMKPVIKHIRKKQQIHVTPVERKLRNRLIKTTRKTPKKSEIIPRKCEQNLPKLVPETYKQNVPEKIPGKCEQNVPKIIPEKCEQNVPKIIPEICEQSVPEIIPETPTKTPEKTMSVVDEINEIANTFLEEDDSMSTPSRIDIISNLIVRKSHRPSSQVFNSTMIHETPYVIPPRSPWRVEVSEIPKKYPILPVKNKSFTPSYTPELITQSAKKQTTLLGFVNRQPKADLPITLFDNNPLSKSRKPFGDLSNSMSPIRPISPDKRSDDSLFGFSVLSNSEDKENSPVKCKSPPKLKKQSPKVKPVEDTQENDMNKNVDVSIDCIPLFEDLNDVKRDGKRYSRQYNRPQTKRKRFVSFKIDSDIEDSDSDTEIHVKKKQKDVLSKEEAEEAERLASHYNSYFDEIENYPLCIE